MSNDKERKLQSMKIMARDKKRKSTNLLSIVPREVLKTHSVYFLFHAEKDLQNTGGVMLAPDK